MPILESLPQRFRPLPERVSAPSAPSFHPLTSTKTLLDIGLAVSTAVVMIVLSYFGISSSERKLIRALATILGVIGIVLVTWQAWRSTEAQNRFEKKLIEIENNTKRPKPALSVADALVLDKEHKVFRLTIVNDGDPGIVDPFIVWMKGGEQTHEAVLPLKLGARHLSRKETGNLPVVFVDPKLDVLMVGNASYLRHMKIHSRNTAEILPMSFCLRLSFAGVDISVERAFRLVPDKKSPLFYHPELIATKCS